MRRRLLRRLLREESGFTLVELVVTMMMMLTVMFALYSIFDMSLRVFGFGNDKTEATENARLGLERMEREIRAAYPQDKASGSDALITSSISNPATEITFGNDLNGNRLVDANEIISYRRGAAPNSTTLLRGNNGTSQSMVEFVDNLTFEHLDRYGGNTTIEGDVHIVRITLRTKVDRSLADATTQTLSTDVALRNRTN